MILFNLDPRISDTITIFLAIVIEAAPFVLLGVLVSRLLGMLVKGEWLVRALPKSPLLAHAVAALLGLAFPVCECGNVPVTRRLLIKGFSVSQAISFYLGAPILNFVVIISTISAFGNFPIIIAGRILGGLFIATVVGLLINYLPRGWKLLRADVAAELESGPQDCADEDCCECEHDHEHVNSARELLQKLRSSKFAAGVVQEFNSMTKYLLVGAAIAAVTQLWLPREFVFALSSNPLLATVAMMTLALIISVCSTVDAFVALAYVGRFSPAALLGFLLYGPMIDIKAIAMLHSVFKSRLVWLLVLLVTGLTLIITSLITALGF